MHLGLWVGVASASGLFSAYVSLGSSFCESLPGQEGVFGRDSRLY
jgi:hypothetical protein